MATRPVSGRMDDWNYISAVGPDVCLTPIGSAKVPVAYDSFVTFEASERTSKSVYNNKKEDFQVNTRAKKIQGHEPGIDKGVVVQGHQKYATIRKGSSTVFSEGWQVVRDGDPAWINRPDKGAVEKRSAAQKNKIKY
ncbi:PAAR-like domain-containing protein [Bartonella sp. HY761]|uniref:PAAR-like domain-containing protein n=1 Tax=Bartonella sp. HY761 TaxID=2979330 RepID=UPI0022097451|nr:PAAR-like domain-containing protein [Bartonella sp. HY761]UXN05583.1 DUF4150 domain-containing protein [Bartonella sp. HY761]